MDLNARFVCAIIATLMKVPHLMTLADLSAPQITSILHHSLGLKRRCEPWLRPLLAGTKRKDLRMPTPTLFGKSIALLFSKPSPATRLSAATSAQLLGGSTLFLGSDDTLQLGANESVRDSARIVGGICQGIFARVGEHEQIEVCLTCSFVSRDLNFFLKKYTYWKGASKIFTSSRPKCLVFPVAPDPIPC